MPRIIRIMQTRGKQWIQANPKRLFQHHRYNPTQKPTTQLETRIRIDLNEHDLHILINHKIKAEHLEIMHLPVRIQRKICCMHCVPRQLLHFGKDRTEVKFLLRGLFCEVFLKLVVGDFVALLMAAVIFALFLDCVVGKVDHWIVHLL